MIFINIRNLRLLLPEDSLNLLKISIMNINDESVLENLNKLIVINRLNNKQILQMVNLVSLSIDINDLKDNLKWENPKTLN